VNYIKEELKMALTNVETALLQLICEKKTASGYELNVLIERRGYREWAGIGKTSIYNTLKKLSKKGFIKKQEFSKKAGKGPMPAKYSVTKNGFKILKAETLLYLSGSARGGNAFELALASIPIAGFTKAAEALGRRAKALEGSFKALKAIYAEKGGTNLPPFVAALFERPLKLIEADMEYTKYLAEKLKK
jgi:DNA-binding PadR family transcriptional regulator